MRFRECPMMEDVCPDITRDTLSSLQLRRLDVAGLARGEPRPRHRRVSAERLAANHKWLIDRVTGRLAAWWPDGIDLQWLHAEAHATLLQSAVRAEDLMDMRDAAVGVLNAQLRRLIVSTDWWERALARRALPLCETWRGIILAGRDPTDHALCSRLRVSPGELAERFMEMTLISAVDPARLLPAHAGAQADACHVLMGLPTAQQLAAALYFEEELTLAEIGRVMGISPERAQELTGRALTAIVARVSMARSATHGLSA